MKANNRQRDRAETAEAVDDHWAGQEVDALLHSLWHLNYQLMTSWVEDSYYRDYLRDQLSEVARLLRRRKRDQEGRR